MKRLFILIALAVSTLLWAEEVPLIPREVLFDNPERAMLRISPNGKQLSYLAPDDNNVLNVWVVAIDGESDPVQVTRDPKRGIRSYEWGDNAHILYSQDRDGDENHHLYQVALETQEMRDLTPFEGAKAYIVTHSRKFPNTRLVAINHRDPNYFDIYRLDLIDGSLEMVMQNDWQAMGVVADHNLVVRAMQRTGEDGGIVIAVRDDADSEWKEIFSWGPEESGEILAFSPDNQKLYYSTTEKGNTARLAEYDLASGGTKTLFEDPRFDVEEVEINPGTFEIEAVGLEGEKFAWKQVSDSVAPDFKELEKQLGSSFRISGRDHADERWVVTSLSDNHPPHYHVYDRNSKKATFIFSAQPAFDEYTLSSTEPVTFKARDGRKIPGYLTLPVGKDRKNLPAIVFVHGGPYLRDKWGFNPTVQWMTNRGYAVLQINYRGSTGYGRDHVEAGHRGWGGSMHDDLIDGKKWLISKGIADPEKVAIYGGSYGGYSTLCGLAFTPDEFCCGVDVVGPSNLVTLRRSFPPYWTAFMAGWDRRVGTDPDFLESRSPLFKADQIKKPLFIAQGANDPRVKQAESDQLVEAMRRNDQEVTYLLFEDEGHGFARPENRRRFYAAVEQFLADQLGGRVEPPSESEDWKAYLK